MCENKEEYRLEDFELKAQEFISLAFELCEQELREHRQNHTEAAVPMRKVKHYSSPCSLC